MTLVARGLQPPDVLLRGLQEPGQVFLGKTSLLAESKSTSLLMCRQIFHTQRSLDVAPLLPRRLADLLAEVGFDEGLEVAVEDAAGVVRDLQRAVVFDPLRGIK